MAFCRFVNLIVYNLDPSAGANKIYWWSWFWYWI